MKVLFVPEVTNSFFCEYVAALSALGVDISTDINDFWNVLSGFDILHIHFPEIICFQGVSSESEAKQQLNIFKLCLSAFKQKGVKIVWTVHNLKGHTPKYAQLDDECYRALAQACDSVFLQGNSGRSELLLAYPELENKLIRDVAHGSYIGAYKDQVSRADARKKLSVPQDCFVFLYFGKIRTYKDIGLLLRSFIISRKEMKNARLLIVGKLSKKNVNRFRLRCFFSPFISLKTSFIPDDDIQYYFRAADVCVFPYKNIFMSGAVVLAQSFGKTVISTDMGCIPDYVNADTGYLYKAGDVLDLNNKIKSSFEDDLSSKENAALKLQERNSWSHIAKDTMEVYELMKPFEP